MPQRGTFSGQIEGVDPALPLLPVVVCAVSLTSSERGGCHRSLRHLLILSEGIMEANDGKKGEATEEIDDQRRCRWLTMAPSLPAVEVVTVEGCIRR
jgi:hypothetical protein